MNLFIKIVAVSILILAVIFTVFSFVYKTVRIEYEYSNIIESNWDLADAASTIPQKSEYIDKFVDALKNSQLEGLHNAVWFKTPENSFNENMKALRSLQTRLHEIQSMDIKSFEYQTAIQQITGQEQGEAQNMISNLKGCWMYKNHFWFWNWMSFILLLIIFAVVIFDYIIITYLLEDY